MLVCVHGKCVILIIFIIYLLIIVRPRFATQAQSI